MELRVAEPKDIGQIAYLILRWFQELKPEQRFFDGEPWEAERAAELMVYAPKYLTKVLVEGDKVIGAFVLIQSSGGIFSPKPYGVLLAVYVVPEFRGHRFLGLKLFNEAERSSRELGLSRLESNPMIGDRGTIAALQRIGFGPPLCTTMMKDLSHG